MIRAVIFDMYETLITHYRSPLYFSKEMAADAGVAEEKFVPAWRGSERDRTVGKIKFEEIIEKIMRENGCFSEEKLELITNKRIRTKEESFLHLHDEIKPLLVTLKSRGLLTGLISNCFSEEAAVIKQSELFPMFDDVRLSYDEGVQKPDAEIYYRCIRALGVSPQECLYVGDGGSSELEAARSIGMRAVQAVWYFTDDPLQRTDINPDFPQADKPMDILVYLG
jgi:putative hydrolase of the HAD superfamily